MNRLAIACFSPIAAGALLVTLLLPAAAQEPSATHVGTLKVAPQQINPAKDFVGRIEAKERVDIRARVTGFLDQIHFDDGQVIKAGDLLYIIEPAPFQAETARMQGALAQAQGQASFADQQLNRAQELLKTEAGSAVMRDQRLAEQLTAQGNVQIAEANLKTSQINLDYTNIKAPISGLIGRTAVTKGNVVGPDHGVLTTIGSQDPMHVLVPVSQREFLTLKKSDRAEARNELEAMIRFSDGSAYDQTGKIDFIDVSVDRKTDSITMRAVVPNPDGRLIDGQLVTVSLELAKPVEKILVPQSALIADQQGVYVFVAQKGKAEVRRLKLGEEHGINIVVEGGLSAGDEVIVEGAATLRPDAPVLTYPAAVLSTGGQQ